MKSQCYLLYLAILAGSCSESKQTQGYIIERNISGVETGMVRLSSYNDDTRTKIVIDSAAITGGKFSLNGNIKSPEILSLSNGENNFGFQSSWRTALSLLKQILQAHRITTKLPMAQKRGPAQKVHSNWLRQCS